MEFLKNIALPQSAGDIELLHYMLVLMLFLFIPFISVILWGTVLSVYFKMKEKISLEENHRKISKDIIELVTVNKSIGIILGIVPLFTAILIFSQLFSASETSNLEFLGIAFILLTIALYFIYDYRDSFENLKTPKVISGIIGSAILFIALWMFVTGITVAVFYEYWKPAGSIQDLFTSVVIIRFIYFLAASIAITGGALLFGFFYLEGGKGRIDKEYGKFVKRIAIIITFTATLLLPLLIFANLIILPGTVLSGAVFAYITIGLFSLFLAYHFLYMIFTRYSSKFTALLFFALLFMIFTVIISDQLIINNSTKVQSAILATKYDVILNELKGEDTVLEISGEEIYKVKCAACHSFDNKIVGPPHNEVVPKYIGKEQQLISFIRNPVKIDPNYPPMPNPGLEPNEAKAVAEYILKQVKQNIGK
ncbi:cytochrome c-551 [bacterium BMS3Abin03]|nr:cytochrome c-551 [bacterium BMS3Abin03]